MIFGFGSVARKKNKAVSVMSVMRASCVVRAGCVRTDRSDKIRIHVVI